MSRCKIKRRPTGARGPAGLPLISRFQPVAVPVSPSAPVPARDLARAFLVPEPEESLHIVKSPIVASFYESPSPCFPALRQSRDPLEVARFWCIVEARN